MKSLPVLREQLHVSVSQIKTYLTCPRRYELQYVRGLDSAFVPVALAFGSAFHTALGFFYRTVQKSKRAPPFEAVVQAFADDWKARVDGPLPIQDEDDEEPVDHLDSAAKMLRVFHAHASTVPMLTVQAVELAFAVELYDPATSEPIEEKLVGAMDLVLASKKKCTVVEFKTGGKRWSQDQLRYDLQPTAYKLAARQLGMSEVDLQLQVFTKTKTPVMQIEELERGADDEDDLQRTIASVLRAIDSGAFHRSRGWACRNCSLTHAC